jgi:hypothetical protein
MTRVVQLIGEYISTGIGANVFHTMTVEFPLLLLVRTETLGIQYIAIETVTQRREKAVEGAGSERLLSDDRYHKRGKYRGKRELHVNLFGLGRVSV